MENKSALILAEALPYIRRFSGKTVVIKYGGNAMTNETLKTQFATDVTLLKLVGIHPVVVHGGGPQINEWLERIGKQSKFAQGMRITDQETMSVVEMVLGGTINKSIVSLINQQGGKAVGITGKDAHFIQARKLFLKDAAQEQLDMGQVGEITAIDASVVSLLSTQDVIPVIAPIGVGEQGESYNINADWVASKLAEALQAEKLILMTNTPGVLDQQGQLLTRLPATQVEALVKNGTLHSGMLPKIGAALYAATHSVAAVHIIDGRTAHALLLELLTDEGVGTMICA